ncbi:MAG: arginine--tRNA ligase [Ignavibacteriaceae bacterium]
MKKYLYKIFEEARQRLAYLGEIELVFDTPKIETHGDLSCNAAMILSKKFKRNPREIASEIISNLNTDETVISKTEIAGPGFINFYFTPSFISEIVKEIIERGDDFGKSKKYSGKKANVEFVSANPTGPLTVGHGRGAVTGDTIANMLEWIGYEVDREYYFNDAGRQMRKLGESVKLRYLEILGEEINFTDEYYQGNYIIDIAQKLFNESGNKLKNESPEGKFKEKAETEIFDDIKNSLKRIGINHKIFYNESSLYKDGRIKELIEKFESLGLSYKKDNATWLKLSTLGGEEDKVIVKATGEPTYRLPDIAYHITKFKRGYDLMVDLFGSDHAATYPDVLAGLRALGYDDSKVKVLIHQFVTFLKDGEVVKMSTRKDEFTPLDELVDEVGSDVVRYFFNMRTISSHLNFDIDLAKKQSDENPVFYLQYAHARICSIIRTVESENLKPESDNLNLLVAEEEQTLLKKLHKFEEEVLYSVENYEPQRICAYLEDLAAAFHKFYTFRRILGSEKNIAEARLALAVATKIVIKNGLTILGVSAPEKM